MVKLRSVIVNLALSYLGGCSINEQGFVSQHYFEGSSSYLVTQEAWGGILGTQSCNAGMAIGHRKITLIYPKYSIDTPAIYLDLIKTNGRSESLIEIDRESIKLDDIEPYAWIETSQGIVFHANKFKFGISLGLNSRRVLALPSNFDGTVLLTQSADGNIKAALQK